MTPKELEQSIRSLFQQPLADAVLRERLETLAVNEVSFSGFTWLFGPELYRRNRVFFRPLILSRFSTFLVLPKWRSEPIRWKGDKAKILEAWLVQVDKDDDVELFRRLYEWSLSTIDRRSDKGARDRHVRTELQLRFAAAKTSGQRQIVLRKFNLWFELDEATAVELYQRDQRLAGPFILRRLPSIFVRPTPATMWRRLIALADQQKDEAFRWRLYRRQIPTAEWTQEVSTLCQTIHDPGELCRELDRRHPEGWGHNLSDGLFTVLQLRGRDVFPYLMGHPGAFRRGFLSRGRYGKAADFARERGWWDLWAALVRSGASDKEFGQEVLNLVENRTLAEADVVARLTALAGASSEWNWPGLGIARVHNLDESVALALYGRFPGLVRGPYKLHISPSPWRTAYARFMEHMLAVGDEELIDHLASRLVTRTRWGKSEELTAMADKLADHYQALKADETVFSKRAANVLGRIPAYSIWRYNVVIKENRLARLLFERSAASYLADPRSMADLVEAGEIHVMALAYRALGLKDGRARQQASAHLPLLMGTLLRPMQRDTRTLAFGAVANAADSPESARLILERAKDALNLPDTHYPKERLLGLIANLLHRWPELRAAREQPVIFERTSA